MGGSTGIIVTIILTISSITSGLRILGLFPHPGISHFTFFHPIARALAEAGHEITVVSHFPDKNPPKGYRDLVLPTTVSLLEAVEFEQISDRKFYYHIWEFFLLHSLGIQTCESAFASDAIKTVLKEAKSLQTYDVILMEQFNTDCMMAVAHIINAPVIALSSCALMPWHYKRIGNPHNPSYISALFLGFSENMNFFERVTNWVNIHLLNFLYRIFSDYEANVVIRKHFGNNIPDVGELVKETSLFFINQHYSLSGAKPLSPAAIELGGIHIQKAQPIEPEFQEILDSAKNGIIYISWGSMLKPDSLPEHKRLAIVGAVKRVNQLVLWKWGNESMIDQPSNVVLRKWMPQREILCHPNVKLFITHGGLMGSSEAAYCGVPVIVIPMYGDQFLNAAAMVHRGMAVILNYKDITEENMFNAINEAMQKKTIENAKKVSYSFRNRPKDGIETAIWWVEHVAATKGALLTKSTSTYLSGIQYYLLDVHLFCVCVISINLGCLYFIIKVLRSHKNNNKKSKQL